MSEQLEFETIVTPADKTEVINMIKEMDAALVLIAGAKDLCKEIAARAKETFAIPPAEFNKVAKLYHKQNLNELQQKHEKTIDLYEKLFDE